MPCTYVLQSIKTNKLYIGSSRENNGLNRLKSHNSGKTRSTKFGRPWKIMYQEYFKNYTDARKREIFLKSGQGRKFIKESWQSGRMRQSCHRLRRGPAIGGKN